MSVWTKSFTVDGAWARRNMWRLLRALTTLNGRKVGRNRRGMAMIINVSGRMDIDGSACVSVEFTRVLRGRTSLVTHTIGESGRNGCTVKRHAMYAFANHNKILKDLTVAESKWRGKK